MSRTTGWSYALARPGQSHAQALSEASATLQIIHGRLTTRLEDKAMALGLLGRAPADAVERAYASLKTARCRQLSVEVKDDRVVIGGIVVRRRTAPQPSSAG